VRLRADQSPDTAAIALRAVQSQIREAAMPHEIPHLDQGFLKEPLTLVSTSGGTSTLRQEYRRRVVLILAVVALVLLIACANISNLLLARGTARRNEMSVRLALGSSRWRLTRQLLVESGLLATIGAAAGLTVAAWASRALVAQLSSSVSPVFLDLSLDWRVMAFTTTVTLVTAVVFGTAAAFATKRVAPIEAVTAAWRTSPESAHRGLRSGVKSLVISQIALSLMLVVAAALFVQTLVQLARTEVCAP
jgi:putative ABC transport system permease protein